ASPVDRRRLPHRVCVAGGPDHGARWRTRRPAGGRVSRAGSPTVWCSPLLLVSDARLALAERCVALLALLERRCRVAAADCRDRPGSHGRAAVAALSVADARGPAVSRIPVGFPAA